MTKRWRVCSMAVLAAGMILIGLVLVAPAARAQPQSLEIELAPFEHRGLRGLGPKGWTAGWVAEDSALIFRPKTRARPAPFLALTRLPADAQVSVPEVRKTLTRMTGFLFSPQPVTVRKHISFVVLTEPSGGKAVAVYVRRADGVGYALGWAKSPGFEKANMIRTVVRAADALRDAAEPSAEPSAAADPNSAAAESASRETAAPKAAPLPSVGGGPEGALFVGLALDAAGTIRGEGGVRNHQFLLLTGGAIFRGAPPGGRLDWTAAQLKRLAPERLGWWKSDGRTMVAHFKKADGAAAKPLIFRIRGDALVLGSTELRRARCRSGALDGTFAASDPPAKNAAKSVASGPAAAQAVRFTADGRFSYEAASGALSYSAAIAPVAGAGTYRIDRCRLTLSPNGGDPSVSTIFPWPGEDRMIAIDGRVFIRR